ncbi:pentatricopeptide repeat-containing protein At1g50270 [Vitis riparia]|uniref:pentatricopeptide repeat-containing protein At1g50270 n=1 Tax=Vitis riparia TaxID=96939 RepID=UPI00155AF8D3|nr:pentatricopeptide repeat-containing protein At1g50270 [Vitis riparia]
MPKLATLRHSILCCFHKCGTFDHLNQTTSILFTSGLAHHTFFLSDLLRSATKDLGYTLLLFDRLATPYILLWNTIIRGFSASSQPQMVLVAYSRLRNHGVIPDRHTFPLLLKAFSKLRNENPFQFYAHIVKFGLDFDAFVQNSLVSAFAHCGYVDCSRRLFIETAKKDVVSWTALINGCLRNGRAVEALECFVEMRSSGVEVDEVTIVSVLCAAAMLRDVWFGRWVHGFYVESGRVIWDVYVGSALVDMYSKCGYCDDAVKVFNEMPTRNLVSWGALIAGYVQCNRYKEALKVFQEMIIEGIEPNQSTVTSALTACAQLGSLDQGRWLHEYVDRSKLGLNSKLGTALVDMYSKCGCVDEALLVFEKLPAKDVYPWTAMINGLAMRGDALSSLNLFSQMIRSRVQPNGVTFLGVLSACAHGGLVDEGLELFRLMICDYRLEPNVDHYGCMVDLLGRAGRLEEAIKFIESMPMEPTPGVWGALFSGCMIHKAFELGEHIGNHLIKLQPHHSGRYILLANLYSRCQKWEAAANVRRLMKGKGVDKSPACSWIEVNGVIHEFIAFDKSHIESINVYMMLESVTAQLKLATYALGSNLLTFTIDGG